MFIKHIISTMIAVLMLFLAACVSGLASDWQFTGDPLQLLILDIDLPPGWELWNLSQEPFPKGENLGAVYKKSQPDGFGTNSLITHEITVFNQVEDAQQALDADYQYSLELATSIAKSFGPYQEDFVPPPKHTYTSPLADEFRVIYAAERGLSGPVVGYSYTVWARYGNVISWFVTIVADEEQTGVGPEEANILPWSEVERLLKLIDERFQKQRMN